MCLPPSFIHSFIHSIHVRVCPVWLLTADASCGSGGKVKSVTEVIREPGMCRLPKANMTAAPRAADSSPRMGRTALQGKITDAQALRGTPLQNTAGGLSLGWLREWVLGKEALKTRCWWEDGAGQTASTERLALGWGQHVLCVQCRNDNDELQVFSPHCSS